MKPFFSIVIPVLNEENYLPKLLFCLEKQTEKSFEVIVVDGRSEDRTVEIVKKFCKKNQQNFNSTLIISDKRNVSFQRNRGADIAKGEYLVFFDADVLLPENYLQKIKENITTNKIDFLTTWNETDSDKQQDKIIALLTNFMFEAAHFLSFDFVPGFNIIVKKNIFTKVGGFDENVVHAEDHDLARRLKEHGYELTILKEPKITFSLRRLKREGTLNVLRKYAKATMHVFLKGPITREIFEYQMGGHLYTKENQTKKRKALFKKQLKLIHSKIETYFKLLERKL